MVRIWLVTLSVWAGVAGAATGWRGDGSGRYEDASAPLTWSAEGPSLWRTELPAWSNATPVPVGNRVYVCAEPFTLLCLSMEDGRILWRKDHDRIDLLPQAEQAAARTSREEGERLARQAAPLRQELRKVERELRRNKDDAALLEKQAEWKRQIADIDGQAAVHQTHVLPSTHQTNGHSSATPSATDEVVVVLFNNGVCAAYTPEGERRWWRYIAKPFHDWGSSTSPLIIGDVVLVHMDKLRALDLANGEERWSADLKPTFGSMTAAVIDGQPVVLTPEGAIVRTSDGTVLANRAGKLTYAAPIVHEGVAYWIEHGGKAIRLPAKAEPFTPETLWTTQPKKERYYASALHHDGLLYAVTRYGDACVIQAASGEVLSSTKLNAGGGGEFYPSLIAIQNHILITHENGTTLVFEPGAEWREVRRNTHEPGRATPVFYQDKLLLRGKTHLRCVEK